MAVNDNDSKGDATKGRYVAQTSVGNDKVDFVANADIVKLFESKYLEKLDAKSDSSKSEAELEKAIESAHKKALKSAYVYEQNLFKQATAEQKKQILEMRQKVFEKEMADIRKESAARLAMHREGTKVYKKELAKISQQEAQLLKSRQEEAKKALQQGVGGFVTSRKAYAETQRGIASEYRDMARAAREAGDREQAKLYSVEARKATNAAVAADNQVRLLEALNKTLTNIGNKISSSVDEAMTNVSKYLPQFSTRLQGSGKDFSTISSLIKKNLAVSPFIKQTVLLENISRGVSQGVAYNLESRAFLASVSDRIADTFDAFDANMSRLIRLQQGDSSMARLGMEASLTRTLNSMFSDTSYLSSAYDTVSAALLDASAQLSKEEAVEFEYTVQKWLGALYSLGLSDAFVSSIAQGINYLGTGNVQALAGNTSLQTLMAMSASRAGIPYGDTLIGGLNARNTNALLESMVEYLQEIAGDTNKVVKSAYGDILGLSLSDLQAVRNLTSQDISTLSSGTLGYGGAMQELQTQLGKVASRTSISQIIDNLFSNALYSVGSTIAENPAAYVLWKVANMIENATGGIHLPAISVMGNMVDLSAFTIEGIMKTGIVGLSSLSLIPAIISSIGNKGGLNLGGWGFNEYTTRGSGMGLAPGSGFDSGVSSSGYVGSGSGSDAKKAALSSATEEAGETAEITNAGMGTDHDFDDLYKALFIEPIPIEVKVAKEVETRFENLIKEILTSIGTNSVLSIMKENAEEKGIPVMVINTETPVKAEVANQTIVDYYTQQSLTIPGAGLGLIGFP